MGFLPAGLVMVQARTAVTWGWGMWERRHVSWERYAPV